MPDFDHPFLQTDNLFIDDACLAAVSKDLRGSLYEGHRVLLSCPDGSCNSLRQHADLSFHVRSHRPCDKMPELDGKMRWRMTNAHVAKDPMSRAVHMGVFRWWSPTGLIHGQVRGFTHLSSARPPVFKSGRCDEQWVMEGQLLGSVIRGTPKGLSVVADYRVVLDRDADRYGRKAKASLEGITWRDCPSHGDELECVEFEDMPPGLGPNPRIDNGATFTIYDHEDNPDSNSAIMSWGAQTGLNCNYRTSIQLPGPCNLVKATLVHFNAAGATVTAVDAGGGTVDSVSLPSTQGVEHSVSLSGAGIVGVEIKPPQDETLLLRICWRPE